MKSKAGPDLQRQKTWKNENDTDQADSVKTVLLEPRMMARNCSVTSSGSAREMAIRPAMDKKNVYPPRRGGDAEQNEAGGHLLGIRWTPFTQASPAINSAWPARRPADADSAAASAA